jgi:hypothetical protein
MSWGINFFVWYVGAIPQAIMGRFSVSQFGMILYRFWVDSGAVWGPRLKLGHSQGVDEVGVIITRTQMDVEVVFTRSASTILMARFQGRPMVRSHVKTQ